MAEYVSFFRYKGEALGGMLDRPSDRAAEVGKLIEAIGGRMIAYYWMFGQYDGFVIFEVPDSRAAAAGALVVAATGTIAQVETHELIRPEDIVGISEMARDLRGGFRAAGT